MRATMIFSKWCPLSRCTLALGLVTLLTVVPHCKAGLTGTSASAYVEKDPTFLNMRPRLGHFPDVEGYLQIYEDYFKHVVRKNDNKFQVIDVNDWRNVRPEAQTCINFLQGFQVRAYKLNKPFEIIMLDACLFWLYDESDEKEFDLERFNSAAKKETKAIKKDAKLKDIFESTMFKEDKIPKKLKQHIYEYLLKLMTVHSENPKNGCHSLWLEAYNDFIEDVYLGDCEDEDDCLFFNLEGAEDDSYLNLIVDATKRASKNCYKVLQTQMMGLMHAAYDEETMTGLYTKIKATTSKVAKQSTSMRWSREMIRILQLITQTDAETPVSLAKVTEVLNNLKQNDETEVERFTAAISEYASARVNLKDTTNDPEGRIRFGKLMTRLCRPYIDPQTFLSQTGGSTLWEDETGMKKPFEFYHLIYSLIRVSNHEAIFDVTKRQFEEDVLKNNWVALYLATFACQMISTTWGQLDYDTNKAVYQVFLRPNAGVLIEDWPVELINQELHENSSPSEPEPEAEVVAEVEPKEPVPVPVRVQVQEPKPKPKPVIVPKPSAPKPVVRAPKPEPELAAPVKRVEKKQSPGRFKFKNPLRPSKEDEQPSKPQESVASNKLEDFSNSVESQPAEPISLEIKDGTPVGNDGNLHSETMQMFYKLHGKYPQKPALVQNEWQSKKAPPQSQVPLAFNFDQSFESAKNKAPEQARPVAKPANKWAALDTLSF